MTLKQYIQELSRKLSKQWESQSHLKSRLNSRLNSLEENTDSEAISDNQELKQIETEIEILERVQPVLSKTRKFIFSCAEKVESALKHIGSEKIRGNRGGTISEDKYQIDGEMKYTARNTTIDGVKYSLRKITFGDELWSSKGHENNPWAEVTEGYENGEQTYYEMSSNGGPYEKIEKTLAYDDVYYASESGIPVKAKKRNPEKDVTYNIVRDFENGETVTLDRPVLDSKGNILGRYNFSQTQSTHKLDKEYFEKTTVIERKCKDKDGKEIILKSEIHDNGFGILKRKDYVDGEMVTEALMNEDTNLFTVTNYKDGKKVSWAHYENLGDGDWEKDKEKFYIEEGYEIDEDELTGNEKHNAYELKSSKSSRDIFYSQEAFLDGAYIPEALESLIYEESFENTGLNHISAEQQLNDLKVRELKEKQQKREQNQSKTLNGKKEWD